MYRRDTKSWLKHLDFMILDLIILQIAFVLSYVLRHGVVNPYSQTLYGSMAVFLLLCDLVIIFFTEPFRNVLKRGYYREFEAIFQQTLLLELFAVLFLFVQQVSQDYSRISMLLLGVLYAAISYPVRLLWKLFLKKTRRQGSRSLLLICTGENAVKTIRNIRDNNYGMYQISGLVLMEPGYVGMEFGGVPVIAEAAEVSDYTQKNWVDEVFVNLPVGMELPHEMLDDFVEMGVTVHLNLSQVAEQIESIHNTCRILFQSDLNYMTGCDKAEAELPQSAERDYLIKFIRDSKRGVIKQYQSRR